MVSATILCIQGHLSGKLIVNENLATKSRNPSSHSQELWWPSSLGDSSSLRKVQAITEVLLVRSAGRKPQSTINLLCRHKQQSIDQTVSLPVSRFPFCPVTTTCVLLVHHLTDSTMLWWSMRCPHHCEMVFIDFSHSNLRRSWGWLTWSQRLSWESCEQLQGAQLAGRVVEGGHEPLNCIVSC